MTAPKECEGSPWFFGACGVLQEIRSKLWVNKPTVDRPTKKTSCFCLTGEKEESFQALKSALVTAPVLALPDFNKTFEIETDASDKGIGAVLMQGGHPIAYLSKALGPRTQGLSTYEKESLAILLAVEHWRSYLQPAEFVIRKIYLII